MIETFSQTCFNDLKKLLLYQKDDKGMLKVAKNRGLLNKLAYSNTPDFACQTLIVTSKKKDLTDRYDRGIILALVSSIAAY